MTDPITWHTLVFDGMGWASTAQTFEEWLDADDVAFPPSWDSFAHYCKTYYKAMPSRVQEDLWSEYSKKGFATVFVLGWVIQRFDPDGRIVSA